MVDLFDFGIGPGAADRIAIVVHLPDQVTACAVWTDRPISRHGRCCAAGGGDTKLLDLAQSDPRPARRSPGWRSALTTAQGASGLPRHLRHQASPAGS